MFQKGKSGNPGGRPKEDNKVKELAREFTAEAVERLGYWLRSDNPKASVGAAIALLDRGYGKPHQESTVTIDDKRDASDWSRDELVAFLADATAGGEGTPKKNGRGGKSDRVH